MAFEFEFLQSPGHRQIYFAWRYLEQAAELVEAPPKNHQAVLLELERYLLGAATSLRVACEAHFGRGKLADAPDQQCMNFISAARHLSAHASPVVTRAVGDDAELKWSNSGQKGTLEVQVTFGLVMDKDSNLSSRRDEDQARRFLQQHDGDLYRSMHEATRLVAGWTKHPLDADFENLLKVPAGKLRAIIDVPNGNVAQRLLEGVRKGQGFNLDGLTVRIVHRDGPVSGEVVRLTAAARPDGTS